VDGRVAKSNESGRPPDAGQGREHQGRRQKAHRAQRERSPARSGRHIIVQAEGKLHIRSEEGPIWLGTEKAGFLLEPNKITIKARNLKLNARKGIVRKGKHDRRNESTDVQAPEGPRIREIESVPRVEGAYARLGPITARWARPQVAMDQTPMIQLFARGLPEPARLDVRVRRCLGEEEVELDHLEPELSAGTHGLSLDCQIEDKAAGPASLKIVGQDARDRIDFTVTHDNDTIESIDALNLLRPLCVKVGMSHKPGLPLQAGTLKLKDRNGHVHEAAIEDGEVNFESVPVGRFQLFGLHEHGELALAITRVNDCHVPPGTTPWLCEEDLSEFATELEIHVLREPILLNLRHDASEEDRRYELTSSELAYFKDQGNATIFIHGYNVGLGSFGKEARELSVRHARGRRSRRSAVIPRYAQVHALETGLPVAANRTPEQLRRAFADIHERADAMREGLDNSHSPDQSDSPYYSKEIRPVYGDLQGEAAHGWLLAMEQHLNEAAGFDGEDYGPFTRLIGVAWDGDHGSTRFWSSELAANRAGRRLVSLLRQLTDEDIKVNVITHSLGARVLLTALNVRGELGEDAIEQAVLWQPAIDQYALSDEPEHAGSFGHEAFPAAHRAVGRIIVLHSKGDGILSPEKWTDNEDRPDDAHGAGLDTFLGWIGGAYPRKYLMEGPNPVHNHFNRRIHRIAARRRGENALREHNAELRNLRPEEKEALRESLREEAAKFEASQDPGDLDLLLPWAFRANLDDPDVLADIERYIINIVRADEHVLKAGYKALGWEFPGVDNDARIKRLVEMSVLDDVNQTGILYSHSGMRFPSAVIQEEIYRNVIWDTYLRSVGFGRY
jgi:hypothetical protein